MAKRGVPCQFEGCKGTVRPPTCRCCHKAQDWHREAQGRKVTPKPIRQAIGARGGAARRESMSQEARSESARKAALARWGKKAD